MVEVQKSVDKWFAKIQADIGKKIGAFVAFLLFLLAIGIFIGINAAQHFPRQAMLAVIIPAVAGVIAYYNRTFAVVLFVIMLIFIFI
ncbi:MAG: hypothetical protein WCI04_05480 [archaeon]